MSLIVWRCNNTVYRGLQVAACPELQHVGNVDCDASWMWLYPSPRAIRHPYLKSSNRLSKKQCKASKVCVAARVQILELLILFRSPSSVYHVPQVAVAQVIILVAFREVILGQFKRDRDQNEEFLHDIFRDVTLELLDLGSMLVDDIRLAPLQLREEFENVVHLNVVPKTWEEFYRALWAISGIVSMFKVRAMLELFLFR